MRRITRVPLDSDTQVALDDRQNRANANQREGALDIDGEWKAARKTKHMEVVRGALNRMMGVGERCMYCLDSHGTDIDHFWPKRKYPDRMFCWPNLLLSCSECNRFKGDSLQLSNEGQPLLVDPTFEDPWEHLDFDPDTGNMCPRYDLSRADYSRKGEETVRLLQLDRREALSNEYRRTFKRLSRIVQNYIARDTKESGKELMRELHEADDHGLLAWCFRGTGENVPPFQDLRESCPETWRECASALDGSG